LAGPPRSVRSQNEHKSFFEVREWINSRAVKDLRKEIRNKAKATKGAATVVGTTGSSRLRLDGAAAKEVEIANDFDEDESDEEWAPSSVTASN
jgi:hypothetical protein